MEAESCHGYRLRFQVSRRLVAKLWTRTRVFISSPRLHPRTRDIALSISGSGSYAATDWDQAIGALGRGGKATKIVGITGPWREVRHPEHPRDSKKRLAVPIYREAERGKDIP